MNALGRALETLTICQAIDVQHQRLSKLEPRGGFAPEAGGAVTVCTASSFGIPVSTTHTITGSILGVGAASRPNGLRRGVFGDILLAWVLTIPCSVFAAALAWWLGKRLLG